MSEIMFEKVTKRYQTFEFNNNSFKIDKGEIVGVVGENGAGKTTLINLLLNKIKRDSGIIKVFGKELIDNEIEIKKKIGVILDESIFYDEFSVEEIQCIMKGIYPEWNKRIFTNYIDLFNLPKGKKIGTFSKGMKRKLDIAVAMSHNADILVFDEVTNGLDIVSQTMIMNILKEHVKCNKVTVLLSTHNMYEIKAVVDKIILIRDGKIVAIEDKENMIEKYGIIEIEDDNIEDLVNIHYEEKCISENGNIQVLIDKSKNNMIIEKCRTREAEIDEIIYMKLKGEK